MSFIPSEAFKEIAKGNASAEDFMGRFYLWSHYRDDLFDKDKPVAPESVHFDLSLLHAFSSNPFFQQHQAFLWPVIHLSALAWVASEDRKQSPDVLERLIAQCLKSQYLDVFLAVAFLVGGWEWALAMSRKYREYHFDDERPKCVDVAV